MDLEAPNWAIKKWGSALLLELAPPSLIKASDISEQQWYADIPLHLRYLAPEHFPNSSWASGRTTVSVPWPSVFWVCPAEDGTKMNTNPFDRTNLGYDGLFGPKTMFYHLQPASQGALMEELSIPVLDLQEAAWVERSTVGVIILGFLWTCWKLFLTAINDCGQSSHIRHTKRE